MPQHAPTVYCISSNLNPMSHRHCQWQLRVLMNGSTKMCKFVFFMLFVMEQSKIFSLRLYTNKQLDRVFHFVRVRRSWKSNTYIQTVRTRALRQNISGQYIHTYKQRERETGGFHDLQFIGRPWWVSLAKLLFGYNSLTILA